MLPLKSNWPRCSTEANRRPGSPVHGQMIGSPLDKVKEKSFRVFWYVEESSQTSVNETPSAGAKGMAGSDQMFAARTPISTRK